MPTPFASASRGIPGRSCRGIGGALLFFALLAARPLAASPPVPPTLQDGIAIRVREVDGIARKAEPATFGCAMTEGADVHKVSELVVKDANGKVVASQMRALQRWHGAPDDASLAIRWLLIDLQVDVPAYGEATYTLCRKSSGKSAHAKFPRLKLANKKGRLTVDTGAAKVQLSATTMDFLDRYQVDLDGDGKVEASERLVDGGVDAGFVLEDRLGAQYGSSVDPCSVVVEEQGKLRTVIRVDGTHSPLVPGSGIGRDFLRFRTRYTFYAGKPYFRVQHVLRNDYLASPLGNIGFESYALQFALHPSPSGDYAASVGLGDGTAFSQAGALRLYQDTDGGASWASSPNASFQGFHVLDAGDSVVAGGGQASGYIDVADGSRGVAIVMRDFWENYPKGFAFDGNRQLRFDVFPKDFASFFWLDDGQQKTTDFLVAGHGALASGVAALATGFQHPLHPYVDAAWTRAARAWGDAGDLDDPDQADETLWAYDDTQVDTLYSQAFARSTYQFGWSDFGEQIWAKSTHTTGSPRNKLTYFDRFAINGSLGAFRVFELFTLHSRDLRPYHIEGFAKEAHPGAILWEGLPVWSLSTDKLGRDQISASLAPHKAGIPSNGHGWNGMDVEHMMIDDVYEYYLLTGDPVCRDALVEMGSCMRTWKIYDPAKAPGTSRGTGWALRALMKIWLCTGDEQVLASADALVTSVHNTYNRAPSPVDGNVYHWVTRYPPNASHIATEEHDIPWQLAVVIHGMLLHHRETGSQQSLDIALDVSDYLVDWCWNGLTMEEAVACDDHTIVNHKPDNTGVNTWIPSALCLAWRYDPRVEYLGVATTMYNSVPNLVGWNSYYGWGLYHWWHDYRALLLGY